MVRNGFSRHTRIKSECQRIAGYACYQGLQWKQDWKFKENIFPYSLPFFKENLPFSIPPPKRHQVRKNVRRQGNKTANKIPLYWSSNSQLKKQQTLVRPIVSHFDEADFFRRLNTQEHGNESNIKQRWGFQGSFLFDYFICRRRLIIPTGVDC